MRNNQQATRQNEWLKLATTEWKNGGGAVADHAVYVALLPCPSPSTHTQVVFKTSI